MRVAKVSEVQPTYNSIEVQDDIVPSHSRIELTCNNLQERADDDDARAVDAAAKARAFTYAACGVEHQSYYQAHRQASEVAAKSLTTIPAVGSEQRSHGPPLRPGRHKSRKQPTRDPLPKTEVSHHEQCRTAALFLEVATRPYSRVTAEDIEFVRTLSPLAAIPANARDALAAAILQHISKNVKTSYVTRLVHEFCKHFDIPSGCMAVLARPCAV